MPPSVLLVLLVLMLLMLTPSLLLLLLLLLLLQELAAHSGRLPERLALGCGTREYSATREHERYDVDQMLLNVS
jgi:sterol desaturase/sphingolipid hydroxylase (fatty acid hydroxylase superfamily)